MDRGANRAIVIGVVGRVLCGRGRRAWRFRARYPIVCRTGAHAVEMDVSERQGELQRQRDERQPTRKPPVGTNPLHRTDLSPPSVYGVPTAHNATGTKRASIGTIGVRCGPGARQSCAAKRRHYPRLMCNVITLQTQAATCAGNGSSCRHSRSRRSWRHTLYIADYPPRMRASNSAVG
jgi:hypothetical protein